MGIFNKWLSLIHCSSEPPKTLSFDKLVMHLKNLGYQHEVIITPYNNDLHHERIVWGEENLTGKFTSIDSVLTYKRHWYLFELEEDALRFKLVW
jgi:hypothetical protein